MALFTHLHDDVFLIFSRKHRHLYEQSLLRIYERHFSQGPSFPKPTEVVHTIYDLIVARPDILGEDLEDEDLPEIVSSRRRRVRFQGKSNDAGERVLKAANLVYSRLVATGWLEEEQFGIRVTVDMPMGALLVMQRLVSLNGDVSQRFGGLVVNIKNSLEAASRVGEKDDPTNSAVYQLRNSRDQAKDFVRTLRAIVSDLKRIRKSLAQADNLNDRITTYFENFIGEVILRDFQDIMAAKNHPYRFKDRILGLAREILSNQRTVEALAEGYERIGIVQGRHEARLEVESDLNGIDQQFEMIGEMFEHMNRFRRGLEIRLKNTVRYAEQGDSGLASRARDLVRRLTALQAEGVVDTRRVPTLIEPPLVLLADALFAKPRQPRKPVEATAIVSRRIDPLHALRKRLKREYLSRINPTPEDVRRYLQAIVPPGGLREARNIEIATVDEFLAFEAARRYALTKDIPGELGGEFILEYRNDGIRHESDWLDCANFVIARRGDLKAEVADAG